MKTLVTWCLVAWGLLGIGGEAARAQGPTALGWQREYYGIPIPTGGLGGERLYAEGVARLSQTRYVMGGIHQTLYSSIGGIPFVTFLNTVGDPLRSVFYPGNIYRNGGYADINDIRSRTDHGFTTVGAVRDSLGRYGTLLMICDSVGRLRARRYINMSYNSQPYDFRLLMLPDNSCILLLGDILSNGHGIPRLFRFDASGTQLWTKTFQQDQEIAIIVPRLDGSYALIGTKSRPVGSGYAQDVWVGGLTAWGDTLPARRYQRLLGNDDPAYGEDAALLPDGGLVIAGATYPLVPPPGTGRPRSDGYLLRLGPTGQVLAQHTVAGAVSARSCSNSELHSVKVLADGRVLAIGPYLRLPNSRTDTYDAAVLTFDPATLNPVGQQFYPDAPTGVLVLSPVKVLYEPNGTLSILGARRKPGNTSTLEEGIGLLRLTAPPLYQLPYCQTPPVARFTATLDAAASTVQVRETATPGPQYGQVVLWHWAWGDGSSSDGPAPGPHTYAAVPVAGTPVALTVTNNLGCTSTVVQYPWGRPSATQQQQALAAALHLYPNPATGPVQVALAGLAAQPPVSAALLDGLGRAVWQGTWPVRAGALAGALDVRGLATGVYTLRLALAEGPVARRLVVQP